MADDLKCSKCNTRNPHGSEYCNSCGKQLGTDCTKCGHTNPQETLYCNKCGSETEHQMDIRVALELMKAQERLEAEKKRQEGAQSDEPDIDIFWICFLGFAIILLGLLGLIW